MKISFLVTYYNQEQYVRDSMESLLAIEKPDEWEILVGDDGSTDGTRDIVQEYIRQDPEHIRLYTMPRERDVSYNPVLRASANRLNLLEHCDGECFCILDGDDFYCDTRFALDAIHVLEEHEDVSTVMFGYRLMTGDHYDEEQRLPAGCPSRMDGETFLRQFYLPGGAGVHRLRWGNDRLAFIKRIGFFDDNDILINSLCYGDLYYIDRCIYIYRQTGASIYTSMSETEKSLLNVQGYDIDLLLTGGRYQKEMLNRCAESVFRIYLEKNRIKGVIGLPKYERYVQECEKLDHSLALRIMKYQELTQAEKRALRRAILRIAGNHPKMAIRLELKHIRGK